MEGEGAGGHEALGGEVVVDDALLVFVPPVDGFAAVGAVVEGVEGADGLAVEGAFAAYDVDDRLLGSGVGEFSGVGDAEYGAEGFELGVERGVFGEEVDGLDLNGEGEEEAFHGRAGRWFI